MKTPETDKELRAWKKAKSYPTDAVPADFARYLERERDALKAEVEQLKRALKKAK